MRRIAVPGFDRVLATVSRRRPGARRRAIQHEKGEQADGVKLLKALGAAVYTFGTRRSRGKACPRCGTFVPEDQGTRQTPGIPDVLAFLRHPAAQPGPHAPLWWEVKRAAGGVVSPAQQAFRDQCINANVWHVVGSLDDLLAWLIAHGHLRAAQVAHYRTTK